MCADLSSPLFRFRTRFVSRSAATRSQRRRMTLSNEKSSTGLFGATEKISRVKSISERLIYSVLMLERKKITITIISKKKGLHYMPLRPYCTVTATAVIAVIIFASSSSLEMHSRNPFARVRNTGDTPFPRGARLGTEPEDQPRPAHGTELDAPALPCKDGVACEKLARLPPGKLPVDLRAQLLYINLRKICRLYKFHLLRSNVRNLEPTFHYVVK